MRSDNLVITIATPKDAALLTALSIDTFCETFAPYNKKEDMDKYISEEMNLTRITEELNDDNNIFFLASDNGIPIGYAKVRGTKIPEALKNNSPLEIERIYVLQKNQDMKTGSALMQHCIDYALSKQYNVIWLGVWEHNLKAIDFYKRWGFALFGSHLFRLGDDDQTDVLMKKKL